MEVIRGSPRLAGASTSPSAHQLMDPSKSTLVSPASDAKTPATQLPVGAPPVPHVDIRTHLEQVALRSLLFWMGASLAEYSSLAPLLPRLISTSLLLAY